MVLEVKELLRPYHIHTLRLGYTRSLVVTDGIHISVRLDVVALMLCAKLGIHWISLTVGSTYGSMARHSGG